MPIYEKEVTCSAETLTLKQELRQLVKSTTNIGGQLGLVLPADDPLASKPALGTPFIEDDLKECIKIVTWVNGYLDNHVSNAIARLDKLIR